MKTVAACDYIDQSAQSLRLSIVEGELDPSQFNVLTEEHASSNGFAITARVIGASHLISLETPSSVVNEVLACAEVTEAHCAFYNPLAAIQGELRLRLPGIKYQFYAETVPVESAEHWLADAVKGKTELVRTGYDFPGLPGDIVPKTMVVICHGEDKLYYHTIHLYPNEGLGVVSTTTIEIEGGKA